MGSLNSLLERCENEKGYIEKASNKNLYSKTENKGTSNYTKYSEDINNLGLMGCQAQPWCATYQFWQEVQEFGLDKALKHWNMTKETYVGYNCFSTYNKFKAVGKVSNKPKLGALVIFKSSHMGRVTKISGNTFWTNEGNTSPKAYDRNGGMVAVKSYSVNDTNIKGFCIIDYETSTSASSTSTPKENLIVKKGQQHAINFTGVKIEVDGIVGSETKKMKARVLQHAMNLDYKKTIEEDGDFGSKSKAKLGSHYVKKGEKQHMVTAAEILMELNGIDPNGVETPGIYGNGLVKAAKTKFNDDGLKITASEFLKLIE